jgi:hypothetical protein
MREENNPSIHTLHQSFASQTTRRRVRRDDRRLRAVRRWRFSACNIDSTSACLAKGTSADRGFQDEHFGLLMLAVWYRSWPPMRLGPFFIKGSGTVLWLRCRTNSPAGSAAKRRDISARLKYIGTVLDYSQKWRHSVGRATIWHQLC